jgi:hypothetical protein
MTFQEVLESHPQPTSLDRNALLRCIEECLDCAASCTGCADADLAEDDVREMVRCIRLCLDSADACDATGRIVTRQTAPDLRLIRAERGITLNFTRGARVGRRRRSRGSGNRRARRPALRAHRLFTHLTSGGGASSPRPLAASRSYDARAGLAATLRSRRYNRRGRPSRSSSP